MFIKKMSLILSVLSAGILFYSCSQEVLDYVPSEWNIKESLSSPNGGNDHFFGQSLSIGEELLAIGAPGENSNTQSIINKNNLDLTNKNGFSNGAVYLYRYGKSGTPWFQSYIKAPNSCEKDRFGYSTAISGNYIVVGAPGESSTSLAIIEGDELSGVTRFGAQNGAVYLYEYHLGQVEMLSYLKAPHGSDEDQFGFSVAGDGNNFLVGAPFEDGGGDTVVNQDEEISVANWREDSGAVYLYSRGEESSQFNSYFKSVNSDNHDQFGTAVAIDQSTVAISAPGEDGSGVSVSGVNLTDADFTDNDDNENSGAVYLYLFDSVEALWGLQAYIKAPNVSAGDLFGHSLALDGDTLVIGAPGEDGATIEVINGTDLSGANDSGNNNGAVYVFVRSDGIWSLQAYLKAPNSSLCDGFGSSVSISGDTIAIGARDEDSSSITLIGGTDLATTNDEGNLNGALYLYSRENGIWSVDSYIKPADNAVGDNFGASCVVGENIVISSSPHKDDMGISSGKVYFFNK